jgi:hypothetical protein
LSFSLVFLSNGNLHITQNSTSSIEGVLFPLIVN